MKKSIYDDEYRKLIARLIEKRKSKGITQKQLAEKMGIDNTIISKAENCVRRLDVIELLNICRTLGIKLNDILKE
jgi:transcriptional regulator with XRE-family HTH domain